MPPTRVHREVRVIDAATNQRLHALFAAQRTIGVDLSLSAMLHRIVVAACELVGAECGAMGLFTADVAAERTYELVVHHGMDATLADCLAGQLMPALRTDPIAMRTVLRVSDLRPGSGGAVPHRDGPVAMFLGVPIPARDQVLGVLFLAEAPEADDAELLAAFAAAAGTAVENARLYEDARRSRDWLNASGEIARVLLAGGDENTLLDVVSRALYIAEADCGSLILPTADGKLEVAVVVGLGAGDLRGRVFDPANSDLGRTIARGESRIIGELTELASPGYDNTHRYGPAMLAPLIDAEGIRGTVMLIRAIERAQFTPSDLDLATTFADQVALAFQLNEARAAAESLRALEDRHRIAQELHDNVIQRLFAVGVGLEGLARGQLPADAVGRLRDYAAELDETINEMRGRVFGLRSAAPAQELRAHHRFPSVPAPTDKDQQTTTA